MWVATRQQNALLEECCWFIECFWLPSCKIFKKTLEFPRIQENKESIDSFGAAERVHHITQTSTTIGILAVGLGSQPKDWTGKRSRTPPSDPLARLGAHVQGRVRQLSLTPLLSLVLDSSVSRVVKPVSASSNLPDWRGSSFCTGFSVGQFLNFSYLPVPFLGELSSLCSQLKSPRLCRVSA